MTSSDQEERLPKRRPFTFEVDSKMTDVLKAYENEDEILFNERTKTRLKKKRFIK